MIELAPRRIVSPWLERAAVLETECDLGPFAETTCAVRLSTSP